MPNGYGAGIASASGGPSSFLKRRQPAALGEPASLCPRGSAVPYGAGAPEAGEDETGVPLAAGADEPSGGRIASTWAIARVIVIGAGTIARIAPSGPRKNWVGSAYRR
jgi:hypothetical protein